MDSKTTELLHHLLKHVDRYEITIQIWPEQKTIYVAKDGVDLYSYGADDLDEVLQHITIYLDRITKKPND